MESVVWSVRPGGRNGVMWGESGVFEGGRSVPIGTDPRLRLVICFLLWVVPCLRRWICESLFGVTEHTAAGRTC